MGVDIRLFTEIKVEGLWYAYSQPEIRQNYNLFDIMGHPRFDQTQRALKRELPELPSEVVSMCVEGDSNFNLQLCSWLNAAEIQDLYMELSEYPGIGFSSTYGNPFGYIEGSDWGAYLKYPEDNPSWIDDIRFIYWFDQN